MDEKTAYKGPTTVFDKETSSDDVGAGQVLTYSGEPPSTHRGHLHRNFKARHIQMITLGGCIGSGLFISTGKALHNGGAAAMLIGYTLICIMALATMNLLSEATCIWPTSGGFIEHANRFVDPAMGFACGFTEWLAWVTVVAAEGAIVRVILTYWTDAIPTAAAMTVYLVIVLGIHALPNKWFAEFEFGTAALKVLCMIIILITCIALLAGAGKASPDPRAYNYTTAPAFPNGMKGVCTTFLLASWATGGQEIMSLTAAEAARPRWDMPRACKNLFIRIVVFYELSIIFLTILVPYNSDKLLGTGTVASSPFVIAMVNAGIKGLPDLMNAIILLGLAAIGAESMYISSRAMVAMAQMGMFPRFLANIDKQGRPRWALIVTAAFSVVFTYINCSSTGGIIFTWFSSVSATVYFMSWMSISITNIQMRKAIKAQNDPVWTLPYAWKLKGFPITAVFLFVTSFLVLFATAYVSLFPIGGAPPNAQTFFETFLGVPIWIVCYLGYKLVYRTKFVKPAEADLQSGRRPLNEEDIAFFDHYFAQPMWKRALSYVRF
ncbi:hypothetical protein LTR10_018651 [Elasticomyces elasticus]|uniref:Amino acid permease/ SLC12A domain-containing protein n=1 Tax=Exophiala sideris TaxID=1016849 RepID=A0ABR0JSV4_9EURO|nr:hypothetical protein LTR10_018651 [Elasticomyces elasticus]KAK5040397.1 hypothetical protein LTS07_000895 [Exophiala sideris]KAK5043177.1 hypothetical protein LTR13_000948 [Exophiala sideris]KAK5068775.1 hypothetical protein LTR69_000896 [Exophiala sideris]KAK5186373.1 hypothetical protein LTR44_001429 [Eurotiomycetes sp. CCFEE 6388]